jgi:CheY-like chemotaxis protein
VSVNVKLSASDTSKLTFVVKDTGTGISKEQAARLFSPFTQADVTTTRRFGGTGLGLVLSKKLAQALGGDVVLTESSPGKGSTFVISIEHGQAREVLFAGPEPTPIREDTRDARVIDLPARETSGEFSRLKILVVDDSPDNLALIRKILTLSGAHVETAGNGREGVTKALRGDFSLVLMDLQMPEMDGFAATRELRNQGYDRPIIALTAHAMKEERKRCLDNGFTDHLTKPIDRNSLIHVLSEYPA